MSDRPPATTPLWISHHPPGSWDRCVRVGRWHVCRRCLVLHPVATAVALAVAVAPGLVPGSVAVPAMWLLPVPATLDWVLEHLGRRAASARRLVFVTAIAAPAVGVALGRWVRSPFDPQVVAPVAVHLAVALVAWFLAVRRAAPIVDPDWEGRFEEAERERRDRLAALVGVEASTQPGTVTKSISSSTAPTSDGSRSL